MLCRKLHLHILTDFNETLHMHALGCGGVHDTIFSLIGLGVAELQPLICQKITWKKLCRKLLLHFSTDFNETLYTHALGCGDVHDTIFSLIGLTVAEL